MEIWFIVLGVVYLGGAIITYRLRGEPHRLRKALFWPLTVTVYILGSIAVIAMIAGIVIVSAVGETNFAPAQFVGGIIALVGMGGALAVFAILAALLSPTGELNG